MTNAARARQYDLVLNGNEIGGGSIRNHKPEIMEKAFAIAGYDEQVLEQKFGGMLRALSLGAPPHGGIAPGIDRIVMLLAGEQNVWMFVGVNGVGKTTTIGKLAQVLRSDGKTVLLCAADTFRAAAGEWTSRNSLRKLRGHLRPTAGLLHSLACPSRT